MRALGFEVMHVYGLTETYGHVTQCAWNDEWNNFDEEIWLGFNLVWVCDGLIADLIQSIGCIGDQFSQEHLFVGVEGVDDQAHQLSDPGLEAKGS